MSFTAGKLLSIKELMIIWIRNYERNSSILIHANAYCRVTLITLIS